MKKVLKALFYIILSLILLVVLAIAYLVFFVNPNQFKPAIIEAAAKYAHGRVLHINGDITWSFFPRIGVHLSDVALDNTADFPKTPPLIAFKEATIRIDTRALLHREIQADKVEIINPEINLIQKSPDKKNWDPLMTPAAPAESNNAAASTPTNLSFTIPVEIKNATITYNNAGKITSINGLNFGAMVSNAEGMTVNKGYLTAASMKLPIIDINHIDAAFNFSNNHFNISKLNLSLPGGTINSKITGNISTHVVKIDSMASSFAVNELLDAMNPKDPKQKPLTLKGIQLNANLQMPEGQAPIINGKATVDKLISTLSPKNNIELSAINAKFGMNNKIFTLSPLTAQLYGGTINATTTTNLKGTMQETKLNSDIKNVDVGALLNALMSSQPITGKAQLTLKDLTINGGNKKDIINNLNGKLTYNITNGSSASLTKIADTINQGTKAASFIAAQLKQKTTIPEINNSGNFSTSDGSGTFANGVLSNTLKITAPLGTVAANGKYRLQDSSMDYHVTLTPLNTQLNLEGRLTGTAEDPKAAFDLMKTLGTSEVITNTIIQQAAPAINNLLNNLIK